MLWVQLEAVVILFHLFFPPSNQMDFQEKFQSEKNQTWHFLFLFKNCCRCYYYELLLLQNYYMHTSYQRGLEIISELQKTNSEKYQPK